MWFFMITCYIMSALSLLLLIAAFLQNAFHFFIFKANEVTFMVLLSIVYLFTETLVIFFFVGMGISVKEYTQEKKLQPNFYQKILQIKRRIYPPLLLNMFFMIVLFILIGAVDTQRFPLGAYMIYFLFCFFHFIYAKKIQHQSFKANTENILAMAGIPRNL